MQEITKSQLGGAGWTENGGGGGQPGDVKTRGFNGKRTENQVNEGCSFSKKDTPSPLFHGDYIRNVSRKDKKKKELSFSPQASGSSLLAI